MKPKNTFYMSLCALALGTSLAAAQEGAPKGEGGGRLAEFLKRADTNNDGKISQEEFNEFSKRDNGDRFSKMDANGDGYVDQTEMAQVAERLREGMRRVGEGSPGGFRRPGAEGGEGGFRRPPGGSQEGDKPGPRPEGDRPGPRPEGDRPGPRPEGDRPMPPGGPGGPGINPDEIFGRIDKNGDGSVDKEEYVEFSKQEIEGRFARMDENADGKVSKEEMRAGIERMRGMMRGGPGGPPGGPGGPPGGPGGFRRPPGGEGGGEGGFRRPPQQEGGSGRPRPEAEDEAPKKDPA
ncbi:MAG: EF-hand domain-containing protein [Prosthecobacter sp.]|nr:EF-hand domain-containing protein [Prosthecobacter sp.]